jgi:hypothetical protein
MRLSVALIGLAAGGRDGCPSAASQPSRTGSPGSSISRDRGPQGDSGDRHRSPNIDYRCVEKYSEFPTGAY